MSQSGELKNIFAVFQRKAATRKKGLKFAFAEARYASILPNWTGAMPDSIAPSPGAM